MSKTEDLTEKKSTTVILESDAYMKVLKKQMEIFEITKKRMPIQDIVAKSVIKGIDLIDIPVLNGKEMKIEA